MQKTFAKFFTPEGSLLRYIVGTAALTVLIQAFYDWVKGNFSQSGVWLAVALLVLLIALIVLIETLQKHMLARKIRPQEQPITPHKGLILLISPGNMEVPRIAIEHHEGALLHCWLIPSQQSLSTADELVKEIHQRWPEVQVHEVQQNIVDPERVESTWKVVERIYSVDGPEVGLAETDIVADITGGLKPMTAGVALACASPQRNMQYVKTVKRDERGNPVPGAPRLAVLITTPQT